MKYEGEPVHPQITLENGPDTVHFEHVHGATSRPCCCDWEVDGPFWTVPHRLARSRCPTAASGSP